MTLLTLRIVAEHVTDAGTALSWCTAGHCCLSASFSLPAPVQGLLQPTTLSPVLLSRNKSEEL
eukprot:2876622-Rhodomonas_salina.1